MSTVAQVAWIVEPFLARHPDFALVGRSVVLKPVGHLMRSFFIDRTSARGYIQPSWSVATMFGPPPKYRAGAGARLVQGVGHVNDQTQARLLGEMELIASDILRTAEIDDLPALSWKAEPIFGPGPMTFAMPLLAKGDFAKSAPYFAKVLASIDAAVEQRTAALRKHRSPHSRPARLDSYALGRLHQSQDGFRRIFDLLSTGDAVAIAGLLRAWEEAAVRLHKVEHLWEPSPFPFETV